MLKYKSKYKKVGVLSIYVIQGVTFGAAKALLQRKGDFFRVLHNTMKATYFYRIFIFKCINGLIDIDFKLTTNNSIHRYDVMQGK